VARSIGPVCPGIRVGARLGATLVAASLAFAASSLAPERASAQNVTNPLHFMLRPPQPKPPPAPANGPMLVQATEIKYDYTNNTVSAVGNVQIYYNGATIEADGTSIEVRARVVVNAAGVWADDVRALEEVRESIQRMLAQAGVNHEIAGSELGDKLEAIRVRNAEAKAQAELADLKRKRRPPLAPMDIFTAAANAAANGDIKHAN